MMWLVSFFVSAVLLGVVYVWATRAFPALARRRRTVGGALATLLVTQTVTRRIVIHWHVAGAVETVLIVLIMTLGIAALPLGLMHAIAWFAERAAKRLRPAASNPEPGAMTRRQVVEAVGGVTFLATTGSMLGWGAVRGRHAFELVELPVRIAGLPRALDGYVIAQISDLHAGTYVGDREFDEGLERVRAAKPDLLVVTGDMVDFNPAYAPLVARRLSGIAPRDGIFACLGDHDYYAGADQVLTTLHAAGVRPLVNDGRLVRPGDGGGFALLGVDDQWSPRYGGAGARLDLALATVPASAPRILLSHQPPTIDRWAGRVALQLSGHTHGGQINPGFRPADMFMRYVAGEYRREGTVLYVNRGFGTVGPPSRVGAPPEVTRIVLVAA